MSTDARRADLHRRHEPAVERAGVDAARHAGRGIALLAGGRHQAALRALRRAASLGDASPVTALNLALALDGAGQPDAARAAMRALAAREPGWDEPPLRLAESLRAAGDSAGTEAAYTRTLAVNPDRAEALIGLAVLLLLRGDAAAARRLLRRCCTVAPDRAEAWDALGLALEREGDHASACAAFAEAQRRAPACLDYALHRVQAATAGDRAAAELEALEAAAADEPTDVVLLVAVGLLRERLGLHEAAIDALDAAVALAPDAAAPLGLLGGLLARAHRLRAAEQILRRAGAADPDNPRIQNDLAAVLMRVHRHAEAQRILLALRERHGAGAAELCNLATATASLGLQVEAVAVAREAVALAPEMLLPRRALYNAMVYDDAMPIGALMQAARDCAACLPPPDALDWPNPPDPARRLRLGLLSGSLKTHPVGWLTIAGFEALPPDGFEIVCLGPRTAGDPMAGRFGAIAGAWHDTDRMDDAALLAFARAQRIDVLIDLGGYGDAGRLGAASRRLAPVQVKWVGMQAHTTGMAAIDWFLTDRWETPDGHAGFYTERLLRLPDGYVCYSPPPHAPEVGPLPAATHGAITFGCFNNLAKINPATIATWCAILHDVEGSRLVLKALPLDDAATALRLRASFGRHGIGGDRLELRGGSSHRALMGQYNHIDLVLDPFPYSGGLTTCEALWMGVPTLTMPGQSFASRHSASHMSNVGLADWVAPDAAGYHALALAKAADLAGLAELRAGLRQRVKASPLCDGRRFGRNLAGALRFAWSEWCATRPPGTNRMEDGAAAGADGA